MRRSGPRPLQKRSVVTVTPGLRSAKPWTASSASTMSDSRRVRGSCGRRIGLGEERRVVALAAVVVGARLEHDLGDRGVRPAARGQDVHRPDHVHLVRDARRRHRGVDDEARVDDRVDLGRVDDSPQQGVVRADAHVLRTLERARRVLGRDADDRLDGLVAFEHLRQPAAPVAGETGDQDSHRRSMCATGFAGACPLSFAIRLRDRFADLIRATPTRAWRSCRRAPPGSGRGPPRRRSARGPCPPTARRPTGRSGWAPGSGA